MAKVQATETRKLEAEIELLEAKARREQAVIGLLSTLRDLALDLRDLARVEKTRAEQGRR